MNSQKSVVSIIGSGRSGSTLLILILGSHDKCFSLGELNKYYRYYKQGKKLCGICERECRFWDSSFTALEKHQLASSLGNTRITSWLPLSLEKRLRRATRTDSVFDVYSTVFSKLDPEINVLIDSSKDPEWVREKLGAREFESGRLGHKVIHLVRDGRAVLSSIKRIHPSRTVSEIAQGWMTKVQDANTFLSTLPSDRKLLIRYEDLILDTDGQLEKICNFLNLSFSREIKNYWKQDHHLIAGNTGTRSLISRYRDQEMLQEVKVKQGNYYEQLGLQLKLDLRWKTELSSEDLQAFNKIAGDFNSSYAFE